MLKKVVLFLISVLICEASVWAKEKKSSQEKKKNALSFRFADMEATEKFCSFANLDVAFKSVPDDCEFFFKSSGPDSESNGSYIVVKKEVLMDGSYIKSAEVYVDEYYGRPCVLIVMNKKGRELFEDITKTHLREKLCIIADGKLIMCAVLMEPITSGRIAVSGIDGEDAEALCKVLSE